MRILTILIIGLSVAANSTFADTVRVAPTSDRLRLQLAVDSSRPGDTVEFAAGEFEPGRIVFRSDRSYVGSPGKTRFVFRDVEFGVAIDADAKDISIAGITFDGAGIDMGAGGPVSRYSNIRISGNAFQNIPGHAIKCTMRNDRLVIEDNTFRNVRGYGAVELYHMNRGSFSRNSLVDCSHGGHILGPLDDCTFSFNRGTGLTHMGLEVQRSGDSVSRNMLVEGNVFYDWKLPYCNSFGLSIMAEGGRNTRIIGNYLRASRVGPWNPNLEGQGERFGIGIEAGFDSGIVEANVIGGPFAHFITSSGPEMLVKNNRFFGQPKWKKAIARWPGIHGKGTFVDKDNSWNRDFDEMPPPPAADNKQACLREPAR